MRKILSVVTFFILIVPVIWGQDTITDIDGNVYQIVQIGDKFFMKENLKVIHYNDGSEILYLIKDNDWISTSLGAYSIPDNNESNTDTYGYLYNWYAVNDKRGICPEGWHVLSNNEYTLLTDYLGGGSVAGGKMKECTPESCPQSEYWDIPNRGATNESGFTALPSGYRDNKNGNYYTMGDYGYFWTSTEKNSNYARYRRLNHYYSRFVRGNKNKKNGFSVRCIKD